MSSLFGVPFITVNGGLEVYNCGVTSRYDKSSNQIMGSRYVSMYMHISILSLCIVVVSAYKQITTVDGVRTIRYAVERQAHASMGH